jgi:CRP/FNR family transcriptional regulator, cyclic AMP receptor protein
MNERSHPEIPALGFARDLNDEERHELSKFGDYVTAEPGQEIIREGEPQEALFLVVSGRVHVQTLQGGRSLLLNSLRSGDSVGEVGIFDPGPASATVSANEFSILWTIGRKELESYMQAHPLASAKVLLNIATLLCKRLRKTNEKVAVQQQLMS